MNLDELSSKPFTNDGDAFEFLMQEIYPCGQFRIHTNKDGIRLFLRFQNPEIYEGFLRFQARHGPKGDRAMVRHSKVAEKVDRRNYDNSFVAPTLHEALNNHVEKFKFDLDDAIKNLGEFPSRFKEFDGSVDEFLKLDKVSKSAVTHILD